MIPKIIHYCWFGGNPLPPLAEKCIASWQKFCPDYEIKRWDESNFDVNCCDYVKEAYAAKKWAFVSDYARFQILYAQGGLYFDTDVELIKPIDDIVATGGFLGIESFAGKQPQINPGLGLGMPCHTGFCEEMVRAYHARHFRNPDGTYNLKTVVAYTTQLLAEHGLQNEPGIQRVCDLYIYPADYFCPKDMLSGKITITRNTRAIHHFDCSWYSEVEIYSFTLKRKLNKFLPLKVAGRIGHFIAQCKYNGVKSAMKRTVGKLKKH